MAAAKTVLITGSSSGFGQAAAQLFHAKGWNVAASMRRPEAAGWASALGLFCPKLDVTDAASIAAAVGATLARFGRIDVLVNNAGYALIGPLEGQTAQQFARQFATNVEGLAAVTRAVLPGMRAQRSGVIINISSIGGRMTFPMTSAYHATKFAVEGLTEALQYELKPFGIRVKLVEPGPVKTEFGGHSMEIVDHPAYHHMVEGLRSSNTKLQNRMPGPAKVAEAIYRAASDGSFRLRYPVHHQPFMFMHGLLSAGLWRMLMGTMLAKGAKADLRQAQGKAGS